MGQTPYIRCETVLYPNSISSCVQFFFSFLVSHLLFHPILLLAQCIIQFPNVEKLNTPLIVIFCFLFIDLSCIPFYSPFGSIVMHNFFHVQRHKMIYDV